MKECHALSFCLRVWQSMFPGTEAENFCGISRKKIYTACT